jgi:hypothetical protein
MTAAMLNILPFVGIRLSTELFRRVAEAFVSRP